MKFSWFLALRYLKPKRTFISIITVISVLGVALGVGVLIVVIAVMSGFEKRIKDDWLRVESPLYVKNGDRGWMEGEDPKAQQDLLWHDLLPKLKNFPGVTGASPYLDLQSMIQEAKPKAHSGLSVPPPPANVPGPDEPEPEPDAPEAPTPPGAQGAQATPGEPAPAPLPAPTVAPDAAETGAAPAALPPDNSTPPSSPPANNAATAPPSAPTAAPAKKAAVVGLDRTRPLVPALIRGVDMDDAEQMEKLTQRFEELRNRRRPGKGQEDAQAAGEFDISPECIVLSFDLVPKLKAGFLRVGLSMVNVFGPKFINEGFDILQENSEAKDDPEKKKALDEQDRDYPLPGELTVTGIFNDDKMQGIGFVSLRTAQQLAGAGFDVDGFGLDLHDPYDAPAMAKKLMDSGILPPGWHVETWIDRHRQQFDAVANERGMMYIVLAFISIVAAFCIMNTMITMAVMKRREIGMMRALGAKISHIVGLFMTNGFIVGLVGTGLGYLIGRTVLHFRNELRQWINDRFGHQIFDSGIYGLWDIPAELRTVDQVIICGLAFILCTLAAVPPAWIVGRMQPAQALRSDR